LTQFHTPPYVSCIRSPATLRVTIRACLAKQRRCQRVFKTRTAGDAARGSSVAYLLVIRSSRFHCC
jgi:hypothetical protein